MTDAEINSMLFRGVITNLNELYGDNGNRIGDDGRTGTDVSFYLAFQPRPIENFAHNYERDKFLHNRDRFVVMNARNLSMILVRCYDRDYITIYRKPLEVAFPNDHERILSILQKLLHKFYSEVQVEDISSLREVDISTGRSSNRNRVMHEL